MKCFLFLSLRLIKYLFFNFTSLFSLFTANCSSDVIDFVKMVVIIKENLQIFRKLPTRKLSSSSFKGLTVVKVSYIMRGIVLLFTFTRLTTTGSLLVSRARGWRIFMPYFWNYGIYPIWSLFSEPIFVD